MRDAAVWARAANAGEIDAKLHARARARRATLGRGPIPSATTRLARRGICAGDLADCGCSVSPRIAACTVSSDHTAPDGALILRLGLRRAARSLCGAIGFL